VKPGRKVPRTAGTIQVYTGNGKGKTTAALGLALRAAGWGMRTYVAQFMKGQHYGELDALEPLKDFIVVEQFGSRRFLHVEKIPSKGDILGAHRALESGARAMRSGKFDIVILDEVNVAVCFGLVSEEEVLQVMDSKPRAVELVLTGRYAPESFIGRADLVTEMKEIKHYFRDGIPARKGIEK
jgi:cob(I)alamin adenosyltransferase